MPTGQVRNREQLASLLWADRQDDQARGSLRTALTGIRRALGDDALIVEQDTVALRPGVLTSDYDRLRTLSDGGAAIASLADIYPGPFLDGLDQDGDQLSDWLAATHSECADLAIAVLEKSAAQATDTGDNQSAITLLRDSLTLEPLRETTHRAIMQAYAAIGERAMAMAQFRTCKELLLLELNAEPDPETKALADSIALKDVGAVNALQQGAASLGAALAATGMPDAENRSDTLAIAVLPFVNVSGDTEQNYFADGITEDIITDLGEVDDLAVAAKGTSQIYRGAALAPAQISRELGVRYLLEGSVRKSGQAVRISAHLIDAQTNLQIWAERYDRQLDNIFELQSDISRAIVGALKLNLKTSRRHVASSRTTTSAQAYQLYLRGRDLLRDRTKPGTRLARELFAQAVALDPNYALGHAGLAETMTLMVTNFNADAGLLQDALKISDRSMEINPSLPEVRAARGQLLGYLGDTSGAKENFHKAIKIGPNYVEAHHYFGMFYMLRQADLENACPSFQNAFEIDNQYINSGVMQMSCLHGLDRLEDERVVAAKVLKAARQRVSRDVYHYDATSAIAEALNVLGETGEARRWLGLSSHRTALAGNATARSVFKRKGGCRKSARQSVPPSARSGA